MTKEATNKANGGEFMLFGVRVVVDSMRKSVSLNNLSQYEHRLDSFSSNDVVPLGYASADDAVANHSSNTNTNTNAAAVIRERKRGVPWTEEEHKLFLLGLEKVGKGDWRGISRSFVKTRTPTQVASHAQKYYLRRNNLNRRRRRSSLFDITTDSVAVNQTNDQQTVTTEDDNRVAQSPPPPPPQPQPSQQQASPKSEISNVRFSLTKSETTRFSTPTAPIYPLTKFNHNRMVNHEMKVVRPLSTRTSSNSMADFDLDLDQNDSSSLSLNLSLSMSASDLSSSRPSSTFQVVQGFNNGDSIISVA